MNKTSRLLILISLSLFFLQFSTAQGDLAEIEISPSHATLKVGEQLTLTATGKDASGSDEPIPQPQWLEDEIDLQNSTTTYTFTAVHTGHFTLVCRDAASGIESSAGVSVMAAPGDTSEILPATGSPPPLTGASLVWHMGDLYLFGGRIEEGSSQGSEVAKPSRSVLNSTWILDVAEARWEEEATYDPPPARADHAATADEARMFVFGGEGGDGGFLGDFWAYNFDSRTWTQIIMDPPLEGVSGPSVYMLPDGTIITCGGYLIRDEEMVPNYKVHRINPTDGSSSRVTFTPTSSTVWYPLGITTTGDEEWALYMLDENFDQVGTYSSTTGQWTYGDIPEPVPPPGLEDIHCPVFVSDAEVLRLFGGTSLEEKEIVAESWEYHLSAEPWAAQTTASGVLIQSAMATILEGDGEFSERAFSGPQYQICSFGGRNPDGSMSDETVIYTPPYEQDLASITVMPEEAQILVNEVIRFVAIGRDDGDLPTSLEPFWSSTGGTIDSLGFFSSSEEGDFTVTASNADNTISGSTIVHVRETVPVRDGEPPCPTEFSIAQNYPNPFNRDTMIEYELPKASSVSLVIHNIDGQIVKSIIHEKQQAGLYTTHWNGTNENGDDVASGVYFYQLEAGDFLKVRKMILIR